MRDVQVAKVRAKMGRFLQFKQTWKGKVSAQTHKTLGTARPIKLSSTRNHTRIVGKGAAHKLIVVGDASGRSGHPARSKMTGMAKLGFCVKLRLCDFCSAG